MIETVLPRDQKRLLSLHNRYRSFLRFLTVGGFCFGITVLVNYGLKYTVLARHPVTALVIATVVATIVSYILNREWSFRSRGGRHPAHEATLYFVVSGIGIALNAVPLYVSRYFLGLQVPEVSLLTQEAADFISGLILGTLIATVFRWWAFRKWVFPNELKGVAIEAVEI
jgi:putative flippase GtrA